MAKINQILQRMCCALIATYRYLLSPWIGHHCRFSPSCSFYMQEAICSHGVVYGIIIGLKRLLRCHPWCAGGIDPVPPHSTKR